MMMSNDIGIDLGTASILVYIKGKGVVLKEPSVVALDRETNKVITFGEEARLMIGRTPGNIVAVRPLRKGVISDYTVTEKMLKYFINKAVGKRTLRKPRIAVCIPSKPILKLQTGKLDSFKKCHGIVKAKKAAIEAMQAEIRDNFQDALNDGALHLLASSSGTDEENAAWVEEIREAFPGVPLLYDNLSLGVSCHIGPGGMGIGCAVAPDYKRV